MTETGWTYFCTLHYGKSYPHVPLELGRRRGEQCEILGRDAVWRSSPFLAQVADGSLKGFIADELTFVEAADIAGGLRAQGYYRDVPPEFPLWQGPKPAGPRWFYVVLADWGTGIVPEAPTEGHKFAEWMAEDLPQLPLGRSVLVHDQITLGRSDRDGTDLNFQALDRDGTWTTETWDDPRYPPSPDHVGVEVTDQLALALMRDGYDLGYYRRIPEELPDPARQTGWASQVSQNEGGHARVHEYLRPAGSPTRWQ